MELLCAYGVSVGGGLQVGSQYRDYALPKGQVQGGKWTPASNKAGLTLTFQASGGKPPGPYCRNLDEPAEGVESKSASPPPPPPPPPPSKEGAKAKA